MNPKLTAEHWEREAIVYIRQSTPNQVRHHLEGQRLQYALQDRARQLGFRQVTVIDDDLGRSALGMADRRGFDQLVSAVCTGTWERSSAWKPRAWRAMAASGRA